VLDLSENAGLSRGDRADQCRPCAGVLMYLSAPHPTPPHPTPPHPTPPRPAPTTHNKPHCAIQRMRTFRCSTSCIARLRCPVPCVASYAVCHDAPCTAAPSSSQQLLAGAYEENLTIGGKMRMVDIACSKEMGGGGTSIAVRPLRPPMTAMNG
jgi:hypothetical protein